MSAAPRNRCPPLPSPSVAFTVNQIRFGPIPFFSSRSRISLSAVRRFSQKSTFGATQTVHQFHKVSPRSTTHLPLPATIVVVQFPFRFYQFHTANPCASVKCQRRSYNLPNKYNMNVFRGRLYRRRSSSLLQCVRVCGAREPHGKLLARAIRTKSLFLSYSRLSEVCQTQFCSILIKTKTFAENRSKI